MKSLQFFFFKKKTLMDCKKVKKQIIWISTLWKKNFLINFSKNRSVFLVKLCFDEFIFKMENIGFYSPATGRKILVSPFRFSRIQYWTRTEPFFDKGRISMCAINVSRSLNFVSWHLRFLLELNNDIHLHCYDSIFVAKQKNHYIINGHYVLMTW